MPRWKMAAIGVAILLLFLVANRGAYKGYFQDDDLDNLAWTRLVDNTDFVKGLATPVFSRNNFRPVGHYYFFTMGRFAGLNFVPYVAVLQFFHVLNGVLLWLLLRQLKIPPMAALAGALFFLYHPATFDAYWQPMYIFDVLCGTFCLLSMLAFIDRRWIVSFLCFVFAYKAKEVAVMLPAVLAFYELWMGGKKWKPLVPFFLFSLLFGVQALVTNASTHDAYTLKLTWTTLGSSIAFYAPRLFPFALTALAVLAFAASQRNRPAYFGMMATVLFLLPLLAIPGRTFSVYLYVPLIGTALATAAILRAAKPPLILGLLAISLSYSFVKMRGYRNIALEAADQNRAYVTGLARFIRDSPQTAAFLTDGAPAAMHPWGINGAIRFLSKKAEIQLAAVDDPEAPALLSQPRLAVLSWEPATRTLQTAQRDPSTPNIQYINMKKGMPVWQFGDGWYRREDAYRWTKPTAAAILNRPAEAKEFEVTVNVGPGQIADIPKITLEVLLDGASIGRREFTTAGWQSHRFPLPPSAPGAVKIEFRTSPEYHPAGDPRILGIAIGGFGFPSGIY